MFDKVNLIYNSDDLRYGNSSDCMNAEDLMLFLETEQGVSEFYSGDVHWVSYDLGCSLIIQNALHIDFHLALRSLIIELSSESVCWHGVELDLATLHTLPPALLFHQTL